MPTKVFTPEDRAKHAAEAKAVAERQLKAKVNPEPAEPEKPKKASKPK